MHKCYYLYNAVYKCNVKENPLFDVVRIHHLVIHRHTETHAVDQEKYERQQHSEKSWRTELGNTLAHLTTIPNDLHLQCLAYATG